jgi:ribosomal protein S18 acetylase RimI-like enzyme
MITIQPTKDHKAIAALNEEVQNLHARIHPDLFKPHNPTAMEAALQVMLSDANSRCYLARENGLDVGYALFFIKEIKENAFHYAINTLYIDQISVLSSHRKSGVGALLMQQAEKLAAENSIRRIELDHWSANTVAASYFRKNGYSLCKERLVKFIY